jgi:hypothetical protein
LGRVTRVPCAPLKILGVNGIDPPTVLRSITMNDTWSIVSPFVLMSFRTHDVTQKKNRETSLIYTRPRDASRGNSERLSRDDYPPPQVGWEDLQKLHGALRLDVGVPQPLLRTRSPDAPGSGVLPDTGIAGMGEDGWKRPGVQTTRSEPGVSFPGGAPENLLDLSASNAGVESGVAYSWHTTPVANLACCPSPRYPFRQGYHAASHAIVATHLCILQPLWHTTCSRNPFPMLTRFRLIASIWHR